MANTWNTSRTNQNFQMRCRQWRPLCVSRRSKSASSMFLRIAAITLLSFPVIAKSSEQAFTSKGHDVGALVQGPDGQVLPDENAYGRRDFDGDPDDEGVVSDQLDPIQLLRALADSGDKDLGGRTENKVKRKWSNNEYLRVWGKRDALRKLSGQEDSTTDSSLQREILRDESRPVGDAILFLLGRKGTDVRGSLSLAQLEEITRRRGTGLHAIEALDLSPQLWGLGAGERPPPKRKWERNSLRIWGKRGESNPLSGHSLSERSMYTNMRRRKWENLPLRVWGR